MEGEGEIPKPSRRDFLRMTGGALGAALTAGIPKIPAGPSREQAVNPELPTDIISREELASKFNTRIYDLPQSQFPNDFVELNLRRSVEKTPLFQRLAEGRLIGMNIVLVNSDRIDPAAFTSEQRALFDENPVLESSLNRQIESAREFNFREIEENRDQMWEEYNTKLLELDARRATLSVDRFSVEAQALGYQYDRYLSEEVKDIDFNEIAMRGWSPTDGSFVDDQGRQGARNYIFQAVRNNPEPTVTFSSGSESLTISANRVRTSSSETGSAYAPRTEQSYPTLNSLDVAENPDLGGYVIMGGRTPGIILRHEMEHSRGVYDETEADRQVIEGIAEAAQHMEETGSDSKYWAVFRTPEGLTITRNPTVVNTI